MTDSIVSKGVRHELDQLSRYLINDSHPLLRRLGERNNNLYDTKAVFVEAKLVQIDKDFVKNERLLLVVEAAALEHFANYVRAVGVNRKIVDVTLQCVSNKVLFLLLCHIVEDSLNRMSALLVTADMNKIFFDQVEDMKALIH